MRRTVGVAVLLAAAHCADVIAGSDLADCAARLAGDGGEASEVCPELAAAIAASPFAGVELPKEQPSTADVLALQSLISAFAEERSMHPIDPAQLDAILATLDIKQKPKSLWQLFREWTADRWRELKQRLGLRNPIGDWELSDWGREVLRSVGWGLFAMLLALAAVGAVMLVRGGPRRIRGIVPGLRREQGAAHPPPTFADLSNEPPGRRLRLLLQIVLAELRAKGQLLDHRALTHREIVGAAAGLDDSQRQALRRVAIGAEQATYSRQEPAEADAHAVVAIGRLLVTQETR